MASLYFLLMIQIYGIFASARLTERTTVLKITFLLNFDAVALEERFCRDALYTKYNIPLKKAILHSQFIFCSL
ncbi:hypothetical protein PRABACTJOHN_01729 [Parabacteroides johnsonii DSM 18315]|uniref:Uncharacterized protein n=2 Tax=Parabacteroides johnsonii TaxID=387661 RepID=A0A9Q5STK7_9BACT|nr:hypothetical protein PRABACTJOHN_01729 [Parabacteroides johnsonii DSM 18315]OUO06429.1 hypothetical protein B5F96_05180 [Parabacteroides johnsonii]